MASSNLILRHRSAVANAVKGHRPDAAQAARAQLAAAKLERSVAEALPLLTPQDRTRISRLLHPRGAR